MKIISPESLSIEGSKFMAHSYFLLTWIFFHKISKLQLKTNMEEKG